MKYYFFALAVCLLFLSYSTERTAASPMQMKISPECARILEYYIITQRIKQYPNLKNVQILERGKPIRVDLTSDQLPQIESMKNIQIIEKGKPLSIDLTSSQLPSVLTKNIRIIERPGEQPVRVDLTSNQEPPRVLTKNMRIVEDGSGEQRIDVSSNGQPPRVLTKNIRVSDEGNTLIKLKPSGDDTDVVFVKGTGSSGSTDEPPVTGIIPGIISETGRIAGHLVDTGAQLIKDDVNFKANLIGGVLGGAGEAASNIIRETGHAVGDAVSNIEEGVDNMLGHF